MKIEQFSYKPKMGLIQHKKSKTPLKKPLVFVFGKRDLLEQDTIVNDILKIYKDASYIFCSTSGNIEHNHVIDNGIVITAFNFEKSTYKIEEACLKLTPNCTEMGADLGARLKQKDLKHVLLFCDGLKINISQLLEGFKSILGNMPITGGLAGDELRFERTLVGVNSLQHQGRCVAIGLYGENLNVGFASVGGWHTFGPERTITKSENTILYELDDKPALELYKKYLGPVADDLPGSALLFPLQVYYNNPDMSLTRTILNVDEENNTMTFAGDIPQGAKARLMRASYNNLVDGAIQAAQEGITFLNNQTPELALLISCVGRKMVLKQQVEEEVEEMINIIGENTCYTGFYSYGEIAPFSHLKTSQLHNQTMTLTLLSEK